MPKRKSARNEKEVVDYQQAREVKDLLRFATNTMPNYVEPAVDAASLAKLEAKAKEWGLPLILVFSDKPAGATSSTLKALSAEYRRRVLIGELRSKRSLEAVQRFGVTSFPTAICLASEGEATRETHRFEGKEPTYRRLDTFVSKCALRKPVQHKPQPKGTSAAARKDEV